MRFAPRRPSPLAWFLAYAAVAVLLAAILAVVNPFVTSWQILGIGVLGGLAGIVPLLRRPLAVLAGVATGLVLVALVTPATAWALAALRVSEPPREADAIVVLGARVNCGSGELGASSAARLERGLELWRAGFARTLVLSDTPPDLGGENCPSVGRLQAERVRRLVPEGGPEIAFLARMLTTRTEALAAAELARARGWGRLLLVTSPAHTRRALGAFRAAGAPETIPVAAEESGFDLALVRPSDRLRALPALAREALGLVKYRLNGWLR